MKIAGLIVALALGACFSDSTYQGDEQDDGPPALPPRFAQLHFDSEPALVAVYDSSGQWRALAGTNLTYGILLVSGQSRYTALAVCVAGAQVRTLIVSDDRTELAMSCGRPPLTVSGSMAQPGTVTLGERSASSTTPSWSFQLPARRSLPVLVASDGERVMVQRNLTVFEDLTLPPIDLSVAHALIAHPFPLTVSDLATGERLTATTRLVTAKLPDGALLYGGALPAKIAPAAALIAGEHHRVELRAELAMGALRTTHTVTSTLRQAAAAYSMWRPFSGASFAVDPDGVVHVAWGQVAGLPKGARVTFEAELADEQGRSIRTTNSVFSDLPGSLSLDTRGVPGYLDEWRVDPALPHQQRFRAERRDQSDDVYTFATAEQIP